MTRYLTLAALATALLGFPALADDIPNEIDGLPLLVSEDFEKSADAWEPSDEKAWRIEDGRGGKVYSQFVKNSKYEPPHRSPLNIALLKDVSVGDFILLAKVKSTVPDYGHRDACLFFGRQGAASLYYVHFGKKTDDHANQIFIVKDAPRTKISTKTTPGTNWDDEWHDVKIVRRVKDGTIEVYFDDMKQPVMTAQDKTFAWGRVGIGSFDDTTQWDDVRLYGQKVDKK
ncbi:MAG: hypothetical protein HYS13_25715 [Planctomycetia bacterium]|nr:hypothetical protein [Planctomycetia bacterium]